MRAAVLGAYHEAMVIEEIDAAPMGDRDVLVRVDASGVCHSDLSIVYGYANMPPPVILGHEGAGTVLAVGTGVSRVAVGDRVVASFMPACGDCFFCLRDQAHLCEQLGVRTMTPKGTRPDGSTVVSMSGLGTLADEMTVHETMLVRVQTDLPFDQLALIGCAVTTGVGAALNTAQVEPGATVAVIGCGGVGQSVVQGARIAGASRIFAVDPVAMKRETAQHFGATDLVDPADADPVEQIRAETNGRGTDYAFEVIGLPETILQTYEVTRRGGTTVIVGMARRGANVTFPAMDLFSTGRRILGCMYGSAQVRRDFPRLVRLVETGRLDVGSMVTRRIRLEEIDDAFRAMESGEVIRSVIT